MTIKRVTFIALNHSSWGGSELLWTQIALCIKSRGLSVSVAIRDWRPMPAQILALEQAGIQLCRFSQIHSQPRWYQRIPTLLLPPAVFKLKRKICGNPSSASSSELVTILKKQKADFVIISADCMWGLPGIQAAAALNLPYVYIMQSNYESWFPADVDRNIMNESIDRIRGLHCFVSKNNHKLFEMQLGRRLQHVEITRNPHAAIHEEALPWPESRKDEEQVGTAPLKMAFVGRLDPNSKGQDILFQVLASGSWPKRNWVLSLYGSGCSQEGVRALARMFGIEQRVRFIPAYSSLKNVWSENHVLVMPSRFEGLPLALAEAMHLGRPAVVTDVADCGCLLRDGIDGFLAEAPTVPAFAKAMERLWLRRNELPMLGRNAAERARAFFPPDPIASATNKILDFIGS